MMSDPIVQVFSKCVPLVAADQVVEIEVEQTLSADSTLLLHAAPSKVKVKIDGPRLQLTPDDVAGVYPAPGSTESPDEFLPHVALSRRTLPWERTGPQAGAPWLALMLFKESELKTPEESKNAPKSSLESTTVQDVQAKDPKTYNKLTGTLGLATSTPLNVLYVRNSTLQPVLPKIDELEYLCHMKRKTENGVNHDVAIVICNRLPDAGSANTKPEIHTAVLVSLEKRSELFTDPTWFADPNALTALVVLHHWTFKPSRGGDFEQVMQAISYRPNGGVLRFGNLPKDVAAGQIAPLSGNFAGLLDKYGFFLDPLPHSQPGNVTYRGPLRPFPTPQRSAAFAIRSAPEEFDNPDPNTPLDYSHAAAFEIGRLLAASDPGVLEDIRDIHLIHDVMDVPAAINSLPPALQKPDWVSNPAWHEEPWQFSPTESLIKDQSMLLQKGVGDVTGMDEQIGQWGQIVLQDLGGMAEPAVPPAVLIDIGTVTDDVLTETFGEVMNAAMS